ncbi:putative receptor-like protein kinase At3g47110 [Hevea brasiliensis]|nr:putative receptor-like protein kinase At3g47110 [Hevea brasiliensis]
MVAHVGDFGLAKFLPQLINPTQSSSIGVRGTIGYTAPEYGLGSEVSTSGDVYSYGILLLEMVTGKKPTDDIFVEGLNLHNFAKMALPNQMLETIDSILLQEDGGVINSQGPALARNDSKIECIIDIIKVGIACSMESPQDRMDISNAVNELNSIRNNFIPSTMGLSVYRGLRS